MPITIEDYKMSNTKMKNVDLIEKIDEQILNIRTKSLDISFNEINDMYENGELIITPNYQRLFRWDESKQSRFIESLILDMPVPPIFVIETSEGYYELIDGLQRISSYIHFRGKEFSIEKGEFVEKKSNNFKLSGCDIIPQINGFSYDTLPKSLQIKLKRNFVRMEVISKESEASLKYHIFKRLNTGGELLSDQEIRNCTIRLLGSEAHDFIIECSHNKDFKNTISKIDKEKIKALYDQELVLRFFALKNDLKSYKYPVTEYLTNYLEKITTKKKVFNYNKEKKIFESTFKFINETAKNDAFSSIINNNNIKNDFVVYLFEAYTIPIANNIEDIIKSNKPDKLMKKILSTKSDFSLQRYKTGSLSNIRTRINLISGIIQDELK